jgi:hypothetical protein
MTLHRRHLFTLMAGLVAGKAFPLVPQAGWIRDFGPGTVKLLHGDESVIECQAFKSMLADIRKSVKATEPKFDLLAQDMRKATEDFCEAMARSNERAR